MKKQLLRVLLVISFLTSAAASLAQPKREFRAAWIQCVNGQFMNMPAQTMQNTLAHQLDMLQQTGCNAIIFQVRAECDALYANAKEPWSRFLTGGQGKAPTPLWDPLQWMVEQCHRRNMELHAWINPYRAKTKFTKQLDNGHIAIKHPERVFPYDGQMILNPALQENRDYICDIIADIVSRYDIDGLHMDDYFYPYPAAGQTIPDAACFSRDNNGIKDIGDWRRYNVNLFVKQAGETIHKIKPWVKFGISPFGIYRNKQSDPHNGSRTNGLQNYDDLYADVLLWVNNGWIDYCVPQLYWQIGHTAADYEELICWWNRHCSKRPLYIGEDVERTVKYPDPKNGNTHQLDAKMSLHNRLPNVKGTVLWYAKAAVDNIGNYSTLLRENYWKNPVLQPSMTFLSDKAPKKVKKVKVLDIDSHTVLFWTAPQGNDWQTAPCQYAVYAFPQGEKADLKSGRHLVAITGDTFIRLPHVNGKTKYTYVITALNRIHNESKAVKKKVRL
ncbi:MAG: family 10 glycosylhydrolase [Prevotella sp.]|nr:family 10 glycosylhydrolase [Prevotella sp.]